MVAIHPAMHPNVFLNGWDLIGIVVVVLLWLIHLYFKAKE